MRMACVRNLPILLAALGLAAAGCTQEAGGGGLGVGGSDSNTGSTTGTGSGDDGGTASGSDDGGSSETGTEGTGTGSGTGTDTGEAVPFADLLVDGEGSNDHSGRAVAAAGDIDGDGLTDLVIGAPETASAAGRVYVVLGTTDVEEIDLGDVASGTGGFAIDGAAAGDHAGHSVDIVGDMSGDGRADIIVGAPDATPSGDGSGAAYVIFGTTDTEAIDLANVGDAGFAINGEAAGDSAGYSTRAAGDVNGDGLADVIVSAYLADVGGSDMGRTYVIFGKADTNTVSLTDIAAGTGGFAVDGESDFDRAGYATAGIGDFNGDALDDIAVGAPFADPSGSHSGRVYVIFGKADTTAVALSDIAAGTGGFALDGEAANDFAGSAIAGAGDINGDGLADLVVGAQRAEAGAPGSGRSYVLFGTTEVPDSQLATIAGGVGGFGIDGTAMGDYAGVSLSCAGDVDGDGLADLIVGAAGADAGGTSSGQSFVVFGKADGNTVQLETIAEETGGFALDGENEKDRSGRAVAGAADINGDGLADVVVGAYLADPGGVEDAGRSYVVFGSDRSGVVTEIGTVGDDLIIGSDGVDTLVGGRGDDTLYGEGGSDVLYGGAGNDLIIVPDVSFFRIDGGTGQDTVHFDLGGVTIDLGLAPENILANIERIDITGTADNTMRMAFRDLRAMSSTSNTLTVEGDVGDSFEIDLSGLGFTDNGSVDGFTEYRNGIFTLRVDDDLDATVTL